MFIKLHYGHSNIPFLVNIDHIVQIEGNAVTLDIPFRTREWSANEREYNYNVLLVMESTDEVQKLINQECFKNWMANMPETP